MSLARSALSRPREALKLMSSTTADWRRLAFLSRLVILPFGGLAVDHQSEPFLEVEGGKIGLPALVFQRLGHAAKAKRDQPLVTGMGEHHLSFRQW